MLSKALLHLYVWALKDIPQDLRDALADAAARETSVTGQRVLQTILRNVNVAEDEKNLVCQDTGIAVYYCRVGEHFLSTLHASTPRSRRHRARDRRASAALEHGPHAHAEHAGPNVGFRVPIVHWDFVPEWDGLDVKCVPKGSGSENMSFLKMCVPADGVAGSRSSSWSRSSAQAGSHARPGS